MRGYDITLAVVTYMGTHFIGLLTSIYIHIYIYIFAVALRPNAGHGLLILEVSKSHTTTHHSR
jgi:hypothetical protein